MSVAPTILTVELFLELGLHGSGYLQADPSNYVYKVYSLKSSPVSSIEIIRSSKLSPQPVAHPELCSLICPHPPKILH